MNPYPEKWVVKKAVTILLTLLLIGLGVVIYINYDLHSEYAGRIHETLEDLPSVQVALVPGASVTRSKKPSPVLMERLERALDLYRSKKVQKILLSGDSEGPYYDEVNVMKDYILQRSVDPKDVFLDHSGLRTLDSVYRSKFIFQIESMIIVTQKVYLPRALYLANTYGIDAHGYTADTGKVEMGFNARQREFLARFLAIIDTRVLRKKPSYLGKTIPISGDGRDTWSK